MQSREGQVDSSVIRP
nr:unnamed protein product [Callosobruchus chinensis]